MCACHWSKAARSVGQGLGAREEGMKALEYPSTFLKQDLEGVPPLERTHLCSCQSLSCNSMSWTCVRTLGSFAAGRAFFKSRLLAQPVRIPLLT